MYFSKTALVIIGILLLSILLIQNEMIDDAEYRATVSQKTLDSLYQEQLPIEIELGRYQVALSILSEKDSLAAQEFEMILSQYTE